MPKSSPSQAQQYKTYLAVFEHLGIYEIVPCPKDCKVVGTMAANESFALNAVPWLDQKYKARIVAQGFTQGQFPQFESINYDETFVPVTKLASPWAILAIAAKCDL
jgi:Reverse transcriptase (RNA-dependent DNA polymerase)